MMQVKEALLLTTCHGLPRLISGKPWYIKVIWLLLFLAALASCLKGTSDFVKKLQSRQVSTALEVNAADFKFPDIYACFENPISSSYAAEMDNTSVNILLEQLNSGEKFLRDTFSAKNATDIDLAELLKIYSFALLHSVQYQTLVDKMAHRLEQAVVSSDINYINKNGLPTYDPLQPTSFYHPAFLRCIRWQVNSTLSATLTKSGTSGGLVTTLLVDTNYSAAAPPGPPSLSRIFVGDTVIPISEWSMFPLDYDNPDRKAGVRIFLCPQGEYPTPFVTSFSLGPGRYHTVEITMTEQVYNAGSFDCLDDPPNVQFLNPYSQEPYNCTYSYSYCYYYEYHRQYQGIMNMSGEASPLPWPLKDARFLFNLSGPGNFLQLTGRVPDDNSVDWEAMLRIQENIQATCSSKAPCTRQLYEASISNTDWPTFSSIGAFVKVTVGDAIQLAGNNSVPALDRLANFDRETAATYLNANVLKVNFRIRSGTSNRVTFSIDYGAANFISDLGGIMGIYLGMSLLTLCEILELVYDLLMVAWQRRGQQVRPGSDNTELSHCDSSDRYDKPTDAADLQCIKGHAH